MKQAHGNWVAGDRFWDREADLEDFIQKIGEGANILLVAPRRMGKTSLMHEAANRISTHYCIFADLQKSETAADSLMEMGRAVYPHKKMTQKWATTATGLLKTCLSNIDEMNIYDFGFKLRAEVTEGNWDIEANKLLDVLAALDKPCVIFMDEVPIMINRLLRCGKDQPAGAGREKADKFLSWIRSNTLRLKGKVSFVISGSIGLSPILNRAGLSATLNTFVPFQLKPWNKETASGCLYALAEEYKLELSPQAVDKMIGLLGCLIPNHVQMFFSHLYDHCMRLRKTSPGLNDVATVYKSEMLGTRGYTELVHYEERLGLVLDREMFQVTMAILSAAAAKRILKQEDIHLLLTEYGFAGDGAKEAQTIILQVLEHDGYLKRHSNGYVFVSNLIRDWWKKRHCCR